ncbi:glycosyl hydrolase family 8 [Microvirga sp. 17 mud 1-3]|uniref:glycosyl hydrolase family 8 n=1 Tax=Microvirga sp. 17 mud 1-3 TaxID=2082949 RepID=UPI000D6D8C93|nr:glycosyl hydrolase family 8 [Microvirga sp. 17 mud 1-3]AWM88541.1 endoglucanase [Microvirga sp. 17 mud 1-3]
MNAVVRCLSGSVLLLLLMAGLTPAARGATMEPLKITGFVSSADWEAYRTRFIEDTGRVVDNANGNISHSEGQGYGLLLAFMAGDRLTFEKIWTFTYTEFLIRDDGLAVWKWDPTATPHVTDRNNATDGDILIAYALAKAGAAWQDQRYNQAAQKLAKAIGRATIAKNAGFPFLLPGVKGFTQADRRDGPVVNLSYWVFEAFPVLATLAPEYDWSGVWREGIVLLQQATAGRTHLPADWISIHNRMMPRTAEGFDPEFGYNSLRIPLYLLRAGMADMDWLKTLRQRWIVDQEGVATVNVVTGEVKERLTDQGYVALSALLACALDGTKVPDTLKAFNPQFYYPASLYLLSMSLIGEKYPQCL